MAAQSSQQQDPQQRDVYGFSLAGLSEQQLAVRAACAAYEERRRAKWQAFAEKQQLPTGATLKRYCRKGVPHELRSWVWWQISGASTAAAAAPKQHFDNCLLAGQAKPTVKQIELDLPRTFPKHPWLSGPHGQAALRDVLTAYSGHNSDVGYCQGMNYLAGLLLLAVEYDCFKAFWLLVVLLDQVLYPGTYAPNLDGCHVEMGCLGQLLQQKQPKLAAHLQAIGCESSLLATDWFVCLFATSLPSESAARVWDALFCEGRKVLHRLGLALLLPAAPQLMQFDNAGEVVHYVKTLAAGYHDRDSLIATAFKGIGGLPRARIAKIQQAEAVKVAAMLEARAASRRKAGLKKTIAAAQQVQQQQQVDAGQQQAQAAAAAGDSSRTLAAVQAQARAAAEQLATGAATAAEQLASGAAAGAAAAAAGAAVAAERAAAAAESVRTGLSKAYTSFNKSS